jgi:hypothetical protein
MRKPLGAAVPIALLQRKCACEEAPEQQEEGATGGLQRKASGLAPATRIPPIVHDVLRSPGRPLDPAARTFFEPRLGETLARSGAVSHATAAREGSISQPGDAHEMEADRLADRLLAPPVSKVQDSGTHFDLSQIRIHSDLRAGESARAVNALAYTIGQDIVFGEGQYSPHSASGQRLLAHELVHTFQQHPGLARQPGPLKPHDPTPKFSPLGGCLGSAVCKDVKTPSKLLEEAKTEEVNAGREKRKQQCGKVPEDPGCRADGHAARAVQTEKLLNTFDPQRLKNAQGIFVDRDIEGDFGAVTTSCNKFTPRLASSGQCITIPQKMEDNAATFNSPTAPPSIDGMERGKWRERTLEILVHEAGHVEFRTSFMDQFKSQFSTTTPSILGKPRPSCKADQDSQVDVFSSLNELTAMVQELPLRLQRMRTSASLSTPQAKEAELEEWRDHRIRGTDQSITNSLRVVRCLCGCVDANDMIKETIDFATGSWNQNEKNDLHREMRDPKWTDLDLRWPFIAPPIPAVTKP